MFKQGKVAVIGAGAAGLASARVLLANTSFEVTVFERSQGIGGLWNYTVGDRNSPMYDSLEANLTKDIMAFSGFPFPEYDPLFPSRYRIQEYLLLYYRRFVKDRVKLYLKTEVTNLEKVHDTGHWKLTTNDNEIHTFDKVVVANGHFNKPNVPQDIAGLDEWKAEYPSTLMHSKNFTSSKDMRGLKVVVVGNGPSGIDIANQITTVASAVYHSVRDVSSANWPSESPIRVVGSITRADATKRLLEFASGEVLTDVDLIIWATGYRYDFPFLKSYHDDLFNPAAGDGHKKLHGLWQDLVFAKDPTIVFPLLCTGIIAFPLAELHACLIAQVFNGQIDPKAITDTTDDVPLVFSDLKDLEYYQDLQKILDAHADSSDALQPVRWNADMCEMRRVSNQLKKDRNRQLVARSRNLHSIGLPFSLY